MSSTALAVKGVEISFETTTLAFDCAVPAKRIVAVAGASGSGKSTLFNIIAGFEQPERGEVIILGEEMTGRAPAERPVSIIFQEHNLFAHLDVATNVGFGISPALRLDAANRTKVEDALARVGLAGFGKRLPPTLSGGERQRVALARAFVRHRPILLLDEPFAALDPGMRAEMRALISDLHEEEGNTILMITHHPDDVRALADSVLFLDRGRIVAHDEVDRFLGRRDIAAINRFLGNEG
ncbi:thiamine ABC transporter ATP-binding protein [Sinorhizobium meliloti WSM1022]|jgi:thiamine transport system ATP-binding protein|uniref:thiamine ABC transporter ATP-binding protein n=1 Tax=Rhizobium meliloti TaxID=382 RepID=UPI0004024063|nr:thiamine ABC transporter ATP-binding protein [Sinorhizobium meliloti]ASQ02498.1 thiamine ABC transporter ATP-binding protein [Sinorhizobium meliloti]MDW9412121.1 thiamine ABC transporter ATP-binding protein [Sinorhizobium meliloti]MDW9441677.1 thiamine ABC transporter ATP-binding protein [Sinorhizobium meliloti]MDW9457609.1 thiamine ABC transporter ATP-binding protein [Sinorhizobium meliloti]MDW9469834.1 thiamine ABC transporter ATP-binding protein [Sinorhizobium meliloti]